jgi:pimeloyl-ACP methyl ester carboxylesterase
MLRFLFFGARQVNVRWFMDRYTEALARYPQAKISYVGHSNGTYLLASALERYRACRIHHVAFAGSVVPKQYPWDRLRAEGRVQAVRNDIASADWIVGVFPGLFELLHWADLGTAGHNGFQDDTPKESSFDRYFQGGHGAALNAANHPSLARFILTGERMPPNQPILVDQQNGLTATLAKLCWLVWLLIIMVLGLIGFGITTGLIGLGISPTLAWGLYGVLVLLLMYTL